MTNEVPPDGHTLLGIRDFLHPCSRSKLYMQTAAVAKVDSASRPMALAAPQRRVVMSVADSTPGTDNTPGARDADPARDLESAARTFQIVRARRAVDSPPDLIAFASSLNFLLTVGYLTKPQAEALIAWFTSSGLTKLPDLPGPTTVAGTTMYEILATAIHFGTPQSIRELIASGVDPGGANILDFFSGLVSAVGDLFTTVTDGITTVLDSGTALLQAGTQFIHALHDDILLA